MFDKQAQHESSASKSRCVGTTVSLEIHVARNTLMQHQLEPRRARWKGTQVGALQLQLILHSGHMPRISGRSIILTTNCSNVTVCSAKLSFTAVSIGGNPLLCVQCYIQEVVLPGFREMEPVSHNSRSNHF